MADEDKTAPAKAETVKKTTPKAAAPAKETAPEAPKDQHIAEIGGGEYVAIGGGQVRRKDQA